MCIFAVRIYLMYIYSYKKWPQFTWDENLISIQLHEVKILQSKLLSKIELLGFQLKDEANLETLIQDIVKTSAIEGEILNSEQVRSSIAIRLGLPTQGVAHANKQIDGVVDMMLDATQNASKKLTQSRLFSWHGALFPTGRSGLYKIDIAKYRKDKLGPMQVVSGGFGKEKVHFQAPNAEVLAAEMKKFISWFNNEINIDNILKAGVAHLWFITLHPFDDGNGRIARAITDMQLTIADGINQRFYSMSSQINIDKKNYYLILEKTQKGNLDITDWLNWFLICLSNAISSSYQIIDKVIKKHTFWAQFATIINNPRQQIMLEKLLDNFEGNLTSSKWAKMTKTSTDTALRDITDLIEKGILTKAVEGGRSANYLLVIQDK
jgi:Fic family protein